VKTWDYLRYGEKGTPAAGSFDGWPTDVASVTIMDPCCGSGHFLVEAFGMLWRMRAEEEGLTPVAAQDAVLRDNLFGLELDPRCVQIAMFSVALTAWKTGGGWRELPVPNIACSGIPAKAPVDEWKALAVGDRRLETALERLHILFRDADTLGSLIDPKGVTEFADTSGSQRSLDDVDWQGMSPLIQKALEGELTDPAGAVLGQDAASLTRAAGLLSRTFTVVATNVPYLKRSNQSGTLRDWVERHHPEGTPDLGIAFLLRSAELSVGGSMALVVPYAWVTSVSYETARRRILGQLSLQMLALMGTGAFSEISGEVVNVTLVIATAAPPVPESEFAGLDASGARSVAEKARVLSTAACSIALQRASLAAPSARVLLAGSGSDLPLLSEFAGCYQGTSTGDNVRYCRMFWEIPVVSTPWRQWQSTVQRHVEFGGREQVVLWHGLGGAERNGAAIRGRSAWGAKGMAVSQMGHLYSTRYAGELFDNNVAALVPINERDVPAVHAFVRSQEFHNAVRAIDQSIKVMNATLPQVPFDVERWRAVAEAAGPLPEPWSDDPTQWLFEGRPEVAAESLQVAVGRLLGYRWPEQPIDDDLDELADSDGIVCLPSVLGERAAEARLHELLARAFGGTWSPARGAALLAQSGAKKNDLESWLRDEFFKAHCQVFRSRPFIWHLWDGRKDGFGALVNYHRLDRPTLERLTYTYLGDWIERQTAGAREDVVGAEERLAAARDLQRQLVLILAGEPPHDIYVRWKSLAEQPNGWDPDLTDGVRVNVRPFVEAGVLRSKFNVKWDKDRGKNPDGSERLNGLHFTTAQKQSARAETPV